MYYIEFALNFFNKVLYAIVRQKFAKPKRLWQ